MKNKIAIIDHIPSGLSAAIAHKLLDMGVEIQIISEHDMANLRQQNLFTQSPPVPELVLPTVEKYFNPPPTRSERRAAHRKTK